MSGPIWAARMRRYSFCVKPKMSATRSRNAASPDGRRRRPWRSRTGRRECLPANRDCRPASGRSARHRPRSRRCPAAPGGRCGRPTPSRGLARGTGGGRSRPRSSVTVPSAFAILAASAIMAMVKTTPGASPGESCGISRSIRKWPARAPISAPTGPPPSMKPAAAPPSFPKDGHGGVIGQLGANCEIKNRVSSPASDAIASRGKGTQAGNTVTVFPAWVPFPRARRARSAGDDNGSLEFLYRPRRHVHRCGGRGAGRGVCRR